ncbi:MAG: Holliday junction resolvase RuvX [Patescibacteria group bacterium]
MLALDLGVRRIGAAVNPTGGALVLELPTIRADGIAQVLDRVRELVGRYQAERILVGTTYAQETASLLSALTASAGVPVLAVDEALTTKEAERQFAQEGQGGDTDARAARLILEQYIREVR